MSDLSRTSAGQGGGWRVGELTAKGAAGRYVRLYSNGNTSDELNHYCEVEVHGTIAK